MTSLLRHYIEDDRISPRFEELPLDKQLSLRASCCETRQNRPATFHKVMRVSRVLDHSFVRTGSFSGNTSAGLSQRYSIALPIVFKIRCFGVAHFKASPPRRCYSESEFHFDLQVVSEVFRFNF